MNDNQKYYLYEALFPLITLISILGFIVFLLLAAANAGWRSEFEYIPQYLHIIVAFLFVFVGGIAYLLRKQQDKITAQYKSQIRWLD